MNYSAADKYKSKHILAYIIQNIHLFTTDLIIFDPNEDLFYLFNTKNNMTEGEKTKIVGNNGNGNRTYSPPDVFAYVASGMVSIYHVQYCLYNVLTGSQVKGISSWSWYIILEINNYYQSFFGFH